MGQANQRGSAEERREQAMARMLDDAEVLIALNENDGAINLQALPRDEVPNQDSAAVILAGFINANLGNLMQTALQARQQHAENLAAGVQNPHMIKQVPVRSLTAVDGGLAKDAPTIVDTTGRVLQ